MCEGVCLFWNSYTNLRVKFVYATWFPTLLKLVKSKKHMIKCIMCTLRERRAEFCIIFHGDRGVFDKLIKAKARIRYIPRVRNVNSQNVIIILLHERLCRLNLREDRRLYELRQIFARPFMWKRIVRIRAPRNFATKVSRMCAFRRRLISRSSNVYNVHKSK